MLLPNRSPRVSLETSTRKPPCVDDLESFDIPNLKGLGSTVGRVCTWLKLQDRRSNVRRLDFKGQVERRASLASQAYFVVERALARAPEVTKRFIGMFERCVFVDDGQLFFIAPRGRRGFARPRKTANSTTATPIRLTDGAATGSEHTGDKESPDHSCSGTT